MGAADRDDWDSRVPCPDGNCVGTIGRDGRCTYCGLAADGTPPGEKEGAHQPAEEELAETGDDERIPCADEMCTGTVNERGVCNYCGRDHPEHRRA